MDKNANRFIKNQRLGRSFWGLVCWSLLRHKYLLPTFSIVQAFLSLAIIYGLALLIPDIQTTEAIYLSSGAVVIGMIGVGCVLAAQIVSSAKQTGVVAYQRTLPVKRYEIIFADLIIWGLASIPGIVMAWIAACWRFHLNLTINPLSIAVMGLVQATMILIGFSIAYWLPTNMVSVATQVIMIGGLLFSPITYPEDRLPEWLTTAYRVLPFVPASKLVRATMFQIGSFKFADLLAVLVWMAVAFGCSNRALNKRG